MRLVAVTQRVTVTPQTAERRDGVDQNWWPFLEACGLLPLPIPNHAATALCLVSQLPVGGLLLTGGDNLVADGGSCPERDETEFALLAYFRQQAKPILGVCRGMQVIQSAWGLALSEVAGHVTPQQTIQVNDQARVVNSYHTLGTVHSVPELDVWGRSADGVVKAIRHRKERITAIMWHPERMLTVDPLDVALFCDVFGRGEEES